MIRFLRQLAPVAFILAAATPAHADKADTNKASADKAKVDRAAKPEKPKPVTIVVLGDSLADGLWASIYRRYARMRHVRVYRETLNSSGFTAYNWQAKLEAILRKYRKIDLAVVQMGTNDRQQLIVRRQRWPRFKSEKWVTHYRERVEKFMARLQEAGIHTVWVGLPVVRRKRPDADYRFITGIYEEAAKAMKAVAYMPSRPLTVDDKGTYVAFKRDARDRRRRFRHDDGIHFSDFGYDTVTAHVIKTAGEKWPGLLPPTAGKK